MRAIVFERNGGPEVLVAKDVSDPEPADGEVLVEVEAAGVNYRDVYERMGRGYGSEPPAIIGVEGAGRVGQSGEQVAWVGVPGSYAQRVSAPRDQLVAIPEGVSSDVAAAVYDGVGKSTFDGGLKALAPTGRMILYGAASGQPDPLPVQRLAPAGSLYVQRPTLATYTRTPELLRQRASVVLELVAARKLN